MSRDPIGPAGGTNTYAYGLGNPVSYSDRSGLSVADRGGHRGCIPDWEDCAEIFALLDWYNDYVYFEFELPTSQRVGERLREIFRNRVARLATPRPVPVPCPGCAGPQPNTPEVPENPNGNPNGNGNPSANGDGGNDGGVRELIKLHICEPIRSGSADLNVTGGLGLVGTGGLLVEDDGSRAYVGFGVGAGLSGTATHSSQKPDPGANAALTRAVGSGVNPTIGIGTAPGAGDFETDRRNRPPIPTLEDLGITAFEVLKHLSKYGFIEKGVGLGSPGGAITGYYVFPKVEGGISDMCQ